MFQMAVILLLLIFFISSSESMRSLRLDMWALTRWWIGKCQQKQRGFRRVRLSALWGRLHWLSKVDCFWTSQTAVSLSPSLCALKLHRQAEDNRVTISTTEILPRGILGVYGWMKSGIACGQCEISWHPVEGFPWCLSAWHQKKV